MGYIRVITHLLTFLLNSWDIRVHFWFTTFFGGRQFLHTKNNTWKFSLHIKKKPKLKRHSFNFLKSILFCVFFGDEIPKRDEGNLFTKPHGVFVGWNCLSIVLSHPSPWTPPSPKPHVTWQRLSPNTHPGSCDAFILLKKMVGFLLDDDKPLRNKKWGETHHFTKLLKIGGQGL